MFSERGEGSHLHQKRKERLLKLQSRVQPDVQSVPLIHFFTLVTKTSVSHKDPNEPQEGGGGGLSGCEFSLHKVFLWNSRII